MGKDQHYTWESRAYDEQYLPWLLSGVKILAYKPDPLAKEE